jgi:GxxExxY protein
MREIDALAHAVIGCVIEVHRGLGPGLLESAYEECLCHELDIHGVAYQRQVALPVSYKSVRLECGYRMDVVAAEQLVVEVKSVDRLAPIHDAQLLTDMRLSRYPAGLLLNFNSAVPRDGIRRMNLPR